MMLRNIKNENENQFVQDFLSKPSHLEFNTWYANQVCQNLLFLTENRVKCVAVVMHDWSKFESQLEALLMICRQMNKIGFFICKEPGNNSHYICGLYSNNQLILINPMGITSHKDFYTFVNKVKNKHSIEKVYLSSSKIQNENYEKPGIVSCGAIVTELGMNILNNDAYKLEEFIKHISKTAKANCKEGLNYLCIESLDILLPQTLSNLLESNSEDDYKNKILLIRMEHLNKLRNIPAKLAKSQELRVINKYLDNVKEGSNSQKIFNKILLEKKYTVFNIADEEEYKLLDLELNNSATSQYLAHANKLEQQLKSASSHAPDNLEGLFNLLKNINDKNSTSKIEDTWATSYGINQALDNWLKDNGQDIAHIINTELSSVHSLVNSHEGSINYAEKIVGYQDSAGEMHETGYVHEDGGKLKKPVVMIVNTSAAVASSKKDFSAEGGNHWQTCVILPKNYKPKFAESLNNEKEILFYLDSLNSGVKTPERFKQILIKGTSYQFTSHHGKNGEEIIHSVTRRIPALCDNMKFIDDLTTNQQLGGSDCGWWALYNALMIVFTGSIDYLQQFKSPSRENGHKLRAIFPDLDVAEQINEVNNGMEFNSYAYGYADAQGSYNYNDLSAGTDTINVFPNVSKSIPILEMHQGVQNKFENTAELEKDAITEEYTKQDFPGNVVVSENGLYLAVIESLEDAAKIELFELNQKNVQSFDTLIHSACLYDVKPQKITNVKISNDGRYLFYIVDESSENDSDKSVCHIDFHLESPLPIKLCHENQWGEVLSDYIISSTGHFIILKYTINSGYLGDILFTFPIPDIDWRIVDVLENKFIHNLKSCNGVSFVDNDLVLYWNNNVLGKLSISKLKIQGEDFSEILSTDKKISIPYNSLCVLHPNKSRFLFIIKGGLNANALFYDINSKRFNRTSIPELRDVSKVLFLPGERLLCVSEHISFNMQQPKKYKLVILDLKDGKAKRPIYLNCPLDNFDYIGVDPTGMSVVVSFGKDVCYVNLPHTSIYRKEYFFQYYDLIVPGKKLLQLGYDAFNSIYKNATTPNANAIFTKNSKTLKIESGRDWILTAGHLSMYPTGIDKKYDKWYPCNVSIQNSEYNIEIVGVGVGDAFVKFPITDTDGSYVAISKYLREMTEVKLPPVDIKKIISCILNNQSVEIDNNPSNHSDIAKTLLSRLAGEQYPTNYTVEQKKFFDALLVLMFGVEGSRNNLTFLTGVMLLDLIASNTSYGRKGHQYNWNNAFVSGPEFKWNDFENKNYGGKFPMATNSTGTGNMTQRKEFIGNDQPHKLPDFQRERVQIREMSIMTHWLQAFSSKYNNYFSNCSSSLDMQNEIKNLFQTRLNAVFCGKENLEFLPYKQPNRGMHSGLKRHYKDEPFVYFLQHKAINEEPKIDECYHRTDHPCKTIPGFVLSGKSKDIVALKTKITAELTVVKKELTYITKTNKSFVDFLKNITNDIKDFEIKGKIIKIIVEYNKWITSYFNPAAFESIENNIFSSVVMKSDFSYLRDDLTEEILKKLKWDMVSSNTEGRITRRQIKKIIKDFNNEKYNELLKNDSLVNSYIDKFIKALQSVVDPLIDFDKGKFMVNLDICMPNYLEREHKIRRLLCDSGIKFTDKNEIEINDILDKLGKFEPLFYFDVGFDIAQKPCQSCYSTYSEPYPSLPYNHDNTICLYNGRHDYYHRIDSSCSNISYEENRHVFREEPKQSALLVLRDHERDPNHLSPGTYILQSCCENEMYMQNQNLSHRIWSIFYIDRNLNKHTLSVDNIEGLKQELSNRYISVSDTLKNIIQKYHSRVNGFLELKAKFVYEAKENGKKACENCWWELDHSFKSNTSVDNLNIGSEKTTKIPGGIISRVFGIKKHKIRDDRTSLVETRDSLPIFTPAYKQVNSDRLISSKELNNSKIEHKSSETIKPSL